MKEFRKLRKDEVLIRVQSVNEYGATLLLFKNARVDMNILDETVGSLNWKREHVRDNKNCIVSIWDNEKREWVSKEDTGTESNTQKEKGLASDSFKRACTNWGIGRELYEAPSIRLNKVVVDIKKNKKDKWVTYDIFRVASITYDRYGHVDGLAIKNQDNKVVFLQEPKDLNWADAKEEIPPIPTIEETIDDKAGPVVETVELQFEEEPKPDTTRPAATVEVINKMPNKKEPDKLGKIIERINDKFVESDEIKKGNDDGPGF